MTCPISHMQTMMMVNDGDDDDEAMEMALRESNLANPVLRCKDGQEAFGYLYEQGRYNGKETVRLGIVLLDVNTPGLEGIKTLKTIKPYELPGNIPVMVFTTSSDDRDAAACYRIGANSYVKNPSIRIILWRPSSVRKNIARKSLCSQHSNANMKGRS